eukprot:GHVR01123510.1.p1 GENE.GHVR01123510.1~~GHVR01123510.1.p1  ORF type:complete len:112 (-),score=1.57 GHVR01123510.1:545-880(-)
MDIPLMLYEDPFWVESPNRRLNSRLSNDLEAQHFGAPWVHCFAQFLLPVWYSPSPPLRSRGLSDPLGFLVSEFPTFSLHCVNRFHHSLGVTFTNYYTQLNLTLYPIGIALW